MKNNNILSYILASINLICAIFHIVFQFELMYATGIYREFLLTENLVIAFVFLYFALEITLGKSAAKQTVTKMNIYFWLTFLVFVVFTQPTITSLNIIKPLLFMPQNYYLLSLGAISFVISILSYKRVQQS